MVADVAIAGAGPAGATLALELARRGMRVAIHEKTRTPRLKPCGEGILPHGVAALRAIGGALPEGVRVRGLRFIVDGESIEADFPDGEGLVVRRDRLHAWLRERLTGSTSVTFQQGRPFAHAGEPLVVGADGLHSQFHRRLPARRIGHPRIGLSTHMTGITHLQDRVEVFFHALGELYVAPSGGGEALVSALLYQRTFRRDALTWLLRDIPELRDRVRRIEMSTPLLASAPLGLDVPRVVAPGLLLIGDAAGAPDPITGDGLALAFASVVPAADAIVAGDLDAYQRARHALGATPARLGRLLLRLSRLRGRPVRALLRRPSLVPTLLDVAMARQPWSVGTLLKALR